MEDMDIGGATEKASATSLLEAAEQRRAARERNLFLDVPSWNGDLIAEYRIIPAKEMTAIAERVARQIRNNNVDPSVGDIELIVHANVGLYMRDPESGDRVPIEDDIGHVGYNRIAIELGKEDEIKSNADAVRYLTAERTDDGGWEENITAINRHAGRIQQWMNDPSRRTVDLGELLAGLV